MRTPTTLILILTALQVLYSHKSINNKLLFMMTENLSLVTNILFVKPPIYLPRFLV